MLPRYPSMNTGVGINTHDSLIQQTVQQTMQQIQHGPFPGLMGDSHTQVKVVQPTKPVLRFDSPVLYEGPSTFQINQKVYPLEWQDPNKAIPVRKDKGSREFLKMLYYVQYVLYKFQISSNSKLFSKFFSLPKGVFTLIFETQNGFQLAYDVQLYRGSSWMMSDANTSLSYHFTTWSAFDFTILALIRNVRDAIEKALGQPLMVCDFQDQAVLAFHSQHSVENYHNHQRSYAASSSSSSDSSNSSDSATDRKHRHHRKHTQRSSHSRHHKSVDFRKGTSSSSNRKVRYKEDHKDDHTKKKGTSRNSGSTIQSESSSDDTSTGSSSDSSDSS
jgi:hypothetical protein